MKHYLAAAAYLLGLTVLSAAEQKPNVLFFLIDDLGYADCGFNGGKEIQTPNIDRLARQGTVLEAHYVQPVCSPTRAALMTGRYPTGTGVYNVVRPHATWGLPLQERTLPSALKEAGYSTHILGKWHLGEHDPAYLPLARGFDHHYGHYFGALDYFTHERDGSLDWYRDGTQLKEEGYTTHLLAAEAAKKLASPELKQKPFFLYMPFNGVHSPMQVPDSYLAPYAQLKGARLKLAGMLAAVDEAIGQVVAALEKNGLKENTLILFSSDNGGPKPGDNTPFSRYKGSIYEGGTRAAAFAHWPGHIPAETRLQHPMHIIDWYPTLLKLAGASAEQKLPVHGQDLWPMLTQKQGSPHEELLLIHSPQRAAIRVGDWKLIHDSAAEPELYHLGQDLAEAHNLAAQQPQRVAELRSRLLAHLANAATPGLQGNEAPAYQGKAKRAKGKK